MNRDTGAASVTAASAAQLEKGNALLEREATRRQVIPPFGGNIDETPCRSSSGVRTIPAP